MNAGLPPAIDALTLDALMSQLAAAQPLDKLQSFTVFTGGRAMAVYNYGTITFQNSQEVELFLAVRNAKEQPK
jgi:hypothetical protein